MYHSISFEMDDGTTCNTWDDWRLIPTSRPVFSSPKTKTKYISVPGANADIDLTEAVKGYPVYENRTGSFEFIVDNTYPSSASRASYNETQYADILSKLNGRHAKAILEDDPSYYYEGRFFVSEYSTEPHWNKVTIKYDVAPYKLLITSSLEPWLWDPFNFNNGVFQEDIFKNVIVDGYAQIDTSAERFIGRMPVAPKIRIMNSEDGMLVAFHNQELGIHTSRYFANGTHKDPELIFSNITGHNSIHIDFSGQGMVSIDFRSGGL